MWWPLVVIGEDVATGACGLGNAAYFAGYCRAARGWSRRLAAGALGLVNLSAVGEAALSQGLYWWWQEGALSPGAWVLARLPLLAATALVSLIVLRRVTA
jgi:hypothetical protein